MMMDKFRDLKSKTFWRDVGAEFVASFMLMAAQSALPTLWGQPVSPSAVQVALGMGFVHTAMINGLAEFGGVHMNPAVSIAMMSCAKISVIRGVVYIITQCVACITATGFIYGVTPVNSRNNLAATLLGPNVSTWQGFLVEMWITCQLIITIFGSTNSKRKGDLNMPGIPIGLAAALGIMSGNGYTGASMNPARSLGPAVILGLWKDHWVYWVGPVCGGLLAVGLYVCLFDRLDSNLQRVQDVQMELPSANNPVA